MSERNSYLVLVKHNPGGLWSKAGVVEAPKMSKAYRHTLSLLYGVDTRALSEDEVYEKLDSEFTDLELHPIQTDKNGKPAHSSLSMLRETDHLD